MALAIANNKPYTHTRTPKKKKEKNPRQKKKLYSVVSVGRIAYKKEKVHIRIHTRVYTYTHIEGCV